MKKNEAAFQIRFKHWLEKNPPETSTGYELKYEKNLTFNFAAWVKKAPHQLRSLLRSQDSMLYHKISDSGIGTKPFDCFVLAGADSWLVIYFEKKDAMVFVNPKWILNCLQNNIKFAKFDELCSEKDNKVIYF